MRAGWGAWVLALWITSAPAADCPAPPRAASPQEMQRLSEQAVDRGLLWRVSKGGHTSYLYGSVHVGKLAWAFPGPKLRAAWAETEVLAVEIDLTEIAGSLAQLQPAALPAPLARRIAAQARAQCLDVERLRPLPAMLQLSTLSLMAARRDGLELSYGQEMAWQTRAAAEGRPVLSLETVQDQLDALEPDDPAALQAQVESGLKQLESGQVRPMFRRLAEAWARSDLRTLARYEDWCQCVSTPAERAALRRLNDERNGPMAERIGELHATGQRLFVVVGALHMTGPQALPTLLRAQGFEVERLLPQ